MNNLNSILIEGVLAADPTTESEGSAVCSFALLSRRYTKDSDGKAVEHVITVPCLATGRLAGVCAEYLKKGRGVHVVGRIDSHGLSVATEAPMLYVFAEHVEFKPQLKKSAADHAEAATPWCGWSLPGFDSPARRSRVGEEEKR